MTEIRIGDQTVLHDREATAAIYEILLHGDPEECGCIFCKNFAVQRNLVYPASFTALLEQLGIDPNKEGEVYEYGPSEDGDHFYGGWFYFVGQWSRRANETPTFTTLTISRSGSAPTVRMPLRFTADRRWQSNSQLV